MLTIRALGGAEYQVSVEDTEGLERELDRVREQDQYAWVRVRTVRGQTVYLNPRNIVSITVS